MSERCSGGCLLANGVNGMSDIEGSEPDWH
jgi:hypothetical protein